MLKNFGIIKDNLNIIVICSFKPFGIISYSGLVFSNGKSNVIVVVIPPCTHLQFVLLPVDDDGSNLLIHEDQDQSEKRRQEGSQGRPPWVPAKRRDKPTIACIWCRLCKTINQNAVSHWLKHSICDIEQLIRFFPFHRRNALYQRCDLTTAKNLEKWVAGLGLPLV